MKLTNVLNLPRSIANAVSRDPYTKGDAHISVTGLIGPARKRALEIRHADDLTEDVADRLWSLMGQIAHGILERSDDQAWTEERLYITRHGWRISGQFDRCVMEDRLLQDYKLTSTYSVKDGCKPEWVWQQNIYRTMLREHGYPVERAQIVTIFRDWSKAKAKNSADYPQAPAAVIDVPMLPDHEVEAFIKARLIAHGAAQTTLPDCTAEERWERPAVWAVRKEGRKTAVRLHDTKEAAEQHAEDLGKGHSVEYRPGESIRCQEGYCPAAPFCEQWQSIAPAPAGFSL